METERFFEGELLNPEICHARLRPARPAAAAAGDPMALLPGKPGCHLWAQKNPRALLLRGYEWAKPVFASDRRHARSRCRVSLVSTRRRPSAALARGGRRPIGAGYGGWDRFLR